MKFFRQRRQQGEQLSPLNKIAFWFIRPLLREKNAVLDEDAFLEEVFNSDFLTTEIYRVVRGFDVTGRPIEEVSPGVDKRTLTRQVKSGQICFVRHDSRRPEYHLSYIHEGQERVVALSPQDWKDVSHNLVKAHETAQS